MATTPVPSYGVARVYGTYNDANSSLYIASSCQANLSSFTGQVAYRPTAYLSGVLNGRQIHVSSFAMFKQVFSAGQVNTCTAEGEAYVGVNGVYKKCRCQFEWFQGEDGAGVAFVFTAYADTDKQDVYVYNYETGELLSHTFGVATGPVYVASGPAHDGSYIMIPGRNYITLPIGDPQV